MTKSTMQVQDGPRSGPRFFTLRSSAVAAIVAVFFAGTAVVLRHSPAEQTIAEDQAPLQYPIREEAAAPPPATVASTTAIEIEAKRLEDLYNGGAVTPRKLDSDWDDDYGH